MRLPEWSALQRAVPLVAVAVEVKEAAVVPAALPARARVPARSRKPLASKVTPSKMKKPRTAIAVRG
jgi:hypothetical protein